MTHANTAVDRLVDALSAFTAVDLSPTLRMHMPQYSQHPEIGFVDARDYENHGYHLQTLLLPEHVGAHVDAPSHVPIDRDDVTIETFPPTALWGRCVTAHVADRDWRPGELLTLDEFLAAIGDVEVRAGDVVLVDFGWSRHLLPGGLGRVYWGANTPGFEEELCRWLAEREVRAVGSDSPTCDLSQVDREVVTAFGHLEWFLPRSILILEGLESLEAVPALSYFAAMPLKIERGSGSPLRPVALVPTQEKTEMEQA
jgi:arylformamidase